MNLKWWALPLLVFYVVFLWPYVKAWKALVRKALREPVSETSEDSPYETAWVNLHMLVTYRVACAERQKDTSDRWLALTEITGLMLSLETDYKLMDRQHSVRR